MTTDRWAVFETSRPRLFRIAFHMTRSSDDAEDLIQETALRWLRADTAAVRTPIGWLVAVITRLAVDGLRRAAQQQRAYAEFHQHSESAAPPVTATTELFPPPSADAARRALRERLQPRERFALEIPEAFDCNYGEIARVLQKNQATYRKIDSRARRRVRKAVAATSRNGDWS